MSPAGFAELRRAKRENYQKIYGSTEVDGDFGREVAELFDALYDHELAALRAALGEAPFAEVCTMLQRYYTGLAK